MGKGICQGNISENLDFKVISGKKQIKSLLLPQLVELCKTFPVTTSPQSPIHASSPLPFWRNNKIHGHLILFSAFNLQIRSSNGTSFKRQAITCVMISKTYCDIK